MGHCALYAELQALGFTTLQLDALTCHHCIPPLHIFSGMLFQWHAFSVACCRPDMR